MKRQLLVLIMVSVAAVAAPASAEALVRIGADVIWMPVATANVDSELDAIELDATHDSGSFGASVHANLGFDVFAPGLKVNYFNQALDVTELDTTAPQALEQEEFEREAQFDLNMMLRVQYPGTDFANVFEAGVSYAVEDAGLGMNAGVGAEYDLLGLPLVDLHVGLMGQYINFPAVLNDTPGDVESLRGMVFIGADFSLGLDAR